MKVPPLKFFQSSFYFIEGWLLFWLVILVLFANKTSFWLTPAVLLLSSSLLLGFVIFFGVMLSIVCNCAAERKKFIYPLLRFGISNACPIELIGFDLNTLDLNNTIIVANYPSNFIEYLLIPITLDEIGIKTRILVAQSGYALASIFTNDLLRLEQKGDNYQHVLLNIKETCSSGVLPIVFPERLVDRASQYNLREFRTGIFSIAQELNKRVLLCNVEHLEHNFGLIKNKTLKISCQYLDKYNSVSARAQLAALNDKFF